MRAALPAKGNALQNRLAQFQAIQSSAGNSFATLYSSMTALSTAEFDSQPFDVSSIGDRAITITARHLAHAHQPIVGCQDANHHGQCADLAHGGLRHIPRRSGRQRSSPRQRRCWATTSRSFRSSRSRRRRAASGPTRSMLPTPANLFTYLKTTLNIDFPIDEWFYAAARVRQPFAIGNRRSCWRRRSA